MSAWIKSLLNACMSVWEIMASNLKNQTQSVWFRVCDVDIQCSVPCRSNILIELRIFVWFSVLETLSQGCGSAPKKDQLNHFVAVITNSYPCNQYDVRYVKQNKIIDDVTFDTFSEVAILYRFTCSEHKHTLHWSMVLQQKHGARQFPKSADLDNNFESYVRPLFVTLIVPCVHNWT